MLRGGRERSDGVPVKICGITNWEDAKLAVDAGADALGFNFYAPSPRYIAPVEARRIARRLPRSIEAAGVFVGEAPAGVQAIAESVGLDWVQLHGEETPASVAQLARAKPVVKAFRVRPGFRSAALRRYPEAAAFLLDGFRPRRRGGTGRSFDWRIARRARRYGRIILAGGLTAENVIDAIVRVRPFAIDVCSGVEASPGKKDPARLRELMRQVEIARRQLR